MAHISSATNPLVKQIVRLHTAKERQKTGLCLIEGERAIKTALHSMKLEQLLCTEAMAESASLLHETITTVSDAVMHKISTVVSPSGILGIFKIPKPPDLTSLQAGLVLAQVSDPGNMGTLIRTAAACGVRSIVIVEGVDPWSPKVLQASVGTIAYVAIFQLEWEALVKAKGTLKLQALVVSGGASLKALNPSTSLLVVGNEARGIPSEWLENCDGRITLSMPGGTESLNAAIAGSIALYQVFVAS